VGELLPYIIGSVAFFIAIALVIALAAALHWGRNREHGLIPYLFYPAITVVILSVLFSGRNFDMPLDLQLDKHPAVVWATRATVLFILLASLERIGRRLLHYGPKPHVPGMLIVAFWIFFLTNVLSSGLFGALPWFSHHHVYTVLAGYAALLITRAEGDTAIRAVRNALFVFLALGALCILWQPHMVLARNYSGLIPGLNVRYAGLATHPNTLGPVVIVFLTCLWSKPYSARWLTLAGWMLGLGSLILSQSKTSWVAFLFCACCIVYFRHGHSLVDRIFDHRRTLVPAMSLLLAMTLLALLGGALMMGGLDRMIAFFDTPAASDLRTLMGRYQIWQAAVDEWRNHPLFGYGLTMWNEDYRARIGMSDFAYTAHNQFLQSLSVAGIVGVTGLTVYVLTLFRYVLKTTHASQGLTLALFIMLMFHSITEVPLSLTSGYGLVQQVHLLLLMVVAAHASAANATKTHASAPAWHTRLAPS
jgi:exopolysaccharide production protein ExoQ